MKVSLLEPSLLKDGPNPGITPDFQVFTSAMEVDPNHENVVRMIGSSTERDLQGDTMAISALTDMSQVEPGMSIWLNHRYTLPDSLFGSLLEKPELRLQGGIADLHITSDVTSLNPDAVRTLGYIKEGRKMGCSIGCIILEYEIDEENDDGKSWWPPIIILHVRTLEWSVVGIPANQRSWVENGIKGLFERSLNQGRGDEALKLAPAMRGLYPRAFQDKLKELNNEALRKDLERVKPRATPDRRIEWDTPRKTFFLSQSLQRGERKATDLDRDAVMDFLAKGTESHRNAEKTMIGWDPASESGSAVLVKSDGDGNVLEGKPLEDEPEESADPLEEMTEEIEETGQLIAEVDVEEEDSAASEGKEISIEQASERLLSFSTDEGHTIKQPPANDVEVQMFNQLASKFGVPQIILDAQGQVQAVKAFPELTPESVQETIAKALDLVEATKAGNKLSKQNREHVQACHDALKAMAGSQWDPCEGLDGGSDGDDEDDEQKSYAAHPGRFFPKEVEEKVEGALTRALAKRLDTFDALEVKSLQDQIVDLRKEIGGFVEALSKHGIDPKAFKDLQSQLSVSQRQLKDIEARARAAEEQLVQLTNMPLGQPTQLRRSVQTGEPVATYQDFAGIRGASVKELPMNSNERRWSLEEALEQTTIVPKKVGDKHLLYRHWPAGVGGSVRDGVRPPLTNAQKVFMSAGAPVQYADGEEVDVPCYDDPGGVSM